MKVLHVITSLNESSGGPCYSVSQLIDELSQKKIDCHLWTIDFPSEGCQILPRTSEVKVYDYKATRITKLIRGLCPVGYRHMQRIVSEEIDIVHNNGLWLHPNLYARKTAVKHKIPFIISPRGMLEPWAFKYGRFKKRIFWHLREKANLDKANLFHATSDMEYQSIRRLGFKQPAAIIPNIVSIPQKQNDDSPKHFSWLKEKKNLVFLSRIHPKKGLELLLSGWKELSQSFKDWQLVVCGDGTSAYVHKIHQLIKKYQIEQSTHFTGFISGRAKAEIFENAKLLVLPSYSENFGMVIAEALAYGVPVITTKSTPWEELETYKCGWWIENKIMILKDALSEAMNLSEAERYLMSERSKALIKEKYSSEKVVQDTIKTYKWVLGQGQAPGCVRFD